MNLDAEQARLEFANRQIQRDEDALMEQRLLMARLSARGQSTSEAAEYIGELESTLQQHYAHRQVIMDLLRELQAQAAT